MRVFDSHCHIENGLHSYNIPAEGKNIIFNSFDSYNRFKEQVGSTDTTTIIFDYQQNFNAVKTLLTNKEVKALKIHSRLQKLSANQYPSLIGKLEEAAPNVPIIIDSFYHGDDLDIQPNLKFTIEIAKKFNHLPIIIAHSGGYNTLKYLYHLKSLDNVFFELSLSLSYLRHTSVFLDLKNLIRFCDKDKIIFGTDYPFVDPQTHLSIMTEIGDELNISVEAMDKILFSNAAKLFQVK